MAMLSLGFGMLFYFVIVVMRKKKMTSTSRQYKQVKKDIDSLSTEGDVEIDDI